MTTKQSKAKRGRPAHGPAEVEAARASILEAAVRVFERRGEHAPVGEILVEADISRGTFYKYFPSKEALRAALLTFGTTQLLSRVQGAVADASDPLSKMEAGIDAFLRVHTENPKVYRVLLGWSLTPGTPLYRIRMRVLDAAAAFIAMEFESLGYPSVDPIVYQVLLGAIETASTRLLAGDGPIDDDLVARTRRGLTRIVAATLQGAGPSVPPLPLKRDKASC